MRRYSPWGKQASQCLPTHIPSRTLCVCRARTCLCSSSMSKGSQQEVGSEGREDSAGPSPAQALPKPRSPSQLGRAASHCKSCGSKLPPQRLSSAAAPPGPPAAVRGGGKGGMDCQRLPDPKGPRRTLLISGLLCPIPSPTLSHHPVASNFIQSPTTALCSALYVW